jgi:hypothetical protein
MTIVEYSSICLNESNYREKIAEARQLVEAAGFQFGVQIHNSITPSFLQKLLSYRDELSLSVHSPALASHFLNLATTSRAAIEEVLRESLDVLKLARTNVFFFHGFFLTDKLIEHNMRDYRRVMMNAVGADFVCGNSYNQSPAALQTGSYAMRKRIFRENLEWLQKRLPDYVVALENDYTAIGNGLQRPQEICELVDNVWFDVGHFWVSSLMHEFDFEREAISLIQKKNIVGVHLNHNFSLPEHGNEGFRDSHGHFYERSMQNLKPILKALKEKKCPRYCLEIINGDARDVEIFLEWMKEVAV